MNSVTVSIAVFRLIRTNACVWDGVLIYKSNVLPKGTGVVLETSIATESPVVQRNRHRWSMDPIHGSLFVGWNLKIVFMWRRDAER
jgi:hypothetical protein